MAVSATTDRPIMEKMETKIHHHPHHQREMAQNLVGDIVLVQEPGAAWVKRPIERIIEIHPSEDGAVRSVTVKTEQGTVTRSARSLRLVEPSSDA
ncbi:hypothetical protein T11_11005 [Trichinella zimbabwensis]|uniref:DUF5641 domain-containing protein n=1 Tax=Trichinella zimbabwensis TaxID=268475 RepID=A0A0V1GTZ7_9BILA|nr:hypothetical protein T11_11005 [Trichinella zimbabwensis]